MKTTENISLGGYAFIIETDAYKDLKAYLEDIRNGFSSDPSAEEIISDIEERIAEILKEQTAEGMVVNRAMIKEIRTRIGNPKELAQEEIETGPTEGAGHGGSERGKEQDRKGCRGRRLYRNIDERVFGGVCSGLGTYFCVDKIIFRLLFLTLFMIGVFGFDDGAFSILAYICLWIAMPAARTDEQKREMRGKPTNLKSYKAKDFDFAKEVKDAADSPAGRTLTRAGGIFLGIILLCIGLSGLLGGILIPALPEGFGNMLSVHVEIWEVPEAVEGMISDILTGGTFWGLILTMTGIGSIALIYGGIMLLFGLKSPSWKPGLVLFIAWLISLFAVIAYTVMLVADILPSLMTA